MADFETTTNPDDCRVWGWSLVPEDGETVDDVEIGIDIESFIERISQSSETVYFHNLKFDAGFIIDWLFRHGFTFTQEKLCPGTFTTLISSMSQFYSVTVKWENGNKTEFRDSLKKLPYSVAEVAKAFDLEIGKGEIDFDKPRPVGYMPDENEKEYMALDVLIIAKALRVQFSSGLHKMTVGSDALHEFKELTGSKLFKRMFPILSDRLDHEIRQSYRGGFTYADVRFKGKRLKSGRTYDVNSLYPSVMRYKLLPYGEPVFRSGEPVYDAKYPLFITSITFVAKLRKNHIPCIQVKNNMHFIATEYQEEITDPITMTITSVDLELWQKHYDLTILSFNGSWYFKGTIGVFNEYIDKWMEVKQNSTGGLRALAKLQLNSLYG